MDILLIIGIILLVKFKVLKPGPESMSWEEYEDVTRNHPSLSKRT